MRNETPGLSERSESNGIDELIDDAARQIVAGEPSSTLRGAVRERIGRRSSPWMSLPALAGAGALVVVALLVGRALIGAPGEPDRARPTVNPAPQIATTDPPVIERVERERSERLERSERSERLARRLAADVAALAQEEDPVIPPLSIEPLTTEPLRAVQIAVDVRSGVMPIEIEPLQIEPLQSE